MIHGFWQDFWRTRALTAPTPEELFRALVENGIRYQAGIDWEPPDLEHLVRTFRTAKGSGGADRWHASELRHLPVQAIGRFRELMLSFEAEGACPRQFSECRMPNKVTQGCTAAADTHPISIFSCFYRTWLSAWNKTPCMRKWLQTHMPSQVCIGQGSEAQLSPE